MMRVTSLSADESKKENVAKLGEPLGQIYSALLQEIATLHFHWREYVELFGNKPARITLLNDAAPFFFRMIQDGLWEMSVLHLARLTDAPVSRGRNERTNLTIRSLPNLIAEPEFKATVARLINEAIAATDFCRDWRNRHIAHRDLKLALDQPTTPLAEGSRAAVKKALDALGAVLNALAGHYFKSETRFDLGAPRGGSASLLLSEDVRAQKAREKRLEEGRPAKEDFVFRDV
jgi:hypothetical protein